MKTRNIRLIARDGAVKEMSVDGNLVGGHRDLILPLVPKDSQYLAPVTDSTIIADENGIIAPPYFAHRRYRFVRFATIAIYEETE